ncbi:MAG: hypothetical protein Q7S87_13070 [Agitococcus sp.]|nr:hypothetical protein [Agitococcus sp.]
MEKMYFSRLSSDAKSIVNEIEGHIRKEISIKLGSNQFASVNVNSAVISIPNSDYFSDGPILHELLHLKRYYLEGVAQVEVYDLFRDKVHKDCVNYIDNDIEHLAIIPIEVAMYPQRREYWMSAVRENITELELIRKNNLIGGDVISRNFNTIFRWIFLRHIIKDYELEARVKSLLESFGAVEKAIQLDGIVASNLPKEVFVREICDFYEFSTDRISLKYASGKEMTLTKYFQPSVVEESNSYSL